MTDKEKILAEVERLTEVTLYALSEYENGRRSAMYDIRKQLIEYINSLPAEKPSEELVDAARNIRDSLYLKEGMRDEYGTPIFLQDTLLKGVIAGANWQKEQMMKGFCYETKVYQEFDDVDDVFSPFTSYLTLEQTEITALPNLGLQNGDKVKVIIIKEDEQ